MKTNLIKCNNSRKLQSTTKSNKSRILKKNKETEKQIRESWWRRRRDTVSEERPWTRVRTQDETEANGEVSERPAGFFQKSAGRKPRKGMPWSELKTVGGQTSLRNSITLRKIKGKIRKDSWKCLRIKSTRTRSAVTWKSKARKGLQSNRPKPQRAS